MKLDDDRLTTFSSESYPHHVSPHRLASQWRRLVEDNVEQGADRFEAVVLPEANHKVDGDKAQAVLVESVVGMLEKLVQDGANAPASFDEVVELISTGRADSIPGVRSIPLKVSKVGRCRPASSADSGPP